MFLIRIVLLAVLLAVPALAQEAAAPTLAERDLLVLTVLQLQVDNATLRLRAAVADLKRPGYRLDLVNGQWTYVAEEKR